MFEGRPARVLAGTPEAGADRADRDVKVGDAGAAIRPTDVSGQGVDDVGFDGAQHVEAASGSWRATEMVASSPP